MDHPLDRELELYLREELDGPRQSEVEAHLDTCASCSGRVDRINRAAVGFDTPRQGLGGLQTTPTLAAGFAYADKLQWQRPGSQPLTSEAPRHDSAIGQLLETPLDDVGSGDQLPRPPIFVAGAGSQDLSLPRPHAIASVT